MKRWLPQFSRCPVIVAVTWLLFLHGNGNNAYAYPPYHSLWLKFNAEKNFWEKPDVSTLEAVGSQGRNECTAWAVCAAIGTNAIRNWYSVNTDDAPPAEALAARGYRMLDASNFYRAGGGDGSVGWHISDALELAKRTTIPFINNPQYGMRISTDGYKTLSTVDDIREEIRLNRPVVSAMEIYSDFDGKKYIYPGPGPGANYSGNHSILIVGYNSAQPGGWPGGEFWECQNSWGAQWGERGFFRVKRGTCRIETAIDRSACVVLNTYICDLNGRKLSQAEQNRVISDAIDGAPSVTNAVHKSVMFDDINKGKLPDGDTIRVSVSRPSIVASDNVTVKLVLPKGMWWKGILLFDKNRTSQHVGVEGDGGDTGLQKTYTFRHDDLLRKDLVLSKAKVFGVHTNMYRIKDAFTKMRPGRTYTFTWVKD